MKIGVIGAGALGLLIGSYLAEEHDVTLYVKRESQKNSIEKNGVERWKQSRFIQKDNIAVAHINQLKMADCYIVCVKQPDVVTVIEALQKMDKQSMIIFVQNGMGHLQLLDCLPFPLLVGSVEHGAKKISDYQVDHLGEGKIKLAPYSAPKQDAREIVSQLSTDVFPVEYAENWENLLKNKLIINAVINPLTALFNAPNGVIITNVHINAIAKNLCNETAAVLGFDPSLAWNHVTDIAKKTENNTSSMRADINEHRQSEIEAITGYIIQQAGKKTIPYTTFVYHAILALQIERNRK